MVRELESTFHELGLSQYLDSFVDQGFDTWDTILDIQESDLDALGVKLGHRRKLQRRIANARGIAPSISLSSPKRNGEEGKRDGSRSSQSGRADGNGDGTGVVKRKYRRHPKPDENAPERPPSAYVLFSNKMRDDLKGHNLTFTEIAKLVGENWQSLLASEKEAYENQANAAKEKYHRDLVEYKKTAEYRKYAQYLQEFKEKQAKQNQDSNKRPKVEPARLRHGSTSSSSAATGTTSMSTGSRDSTSSSSERIQGSEPPPTPQERTGSGASMADSLMSNQMDDPRSSPRTGHFGRDATLMNMPMREVGRGPETGRQPLPSLSDMMLDDNRSTMSSTSPIDASSHARPSYVGAGMRNSMNGPAPMLHHESSTGSNGSTRSSNAMHGYGRPSSDGPMPIHALLTGRSCPRPAQSPIDHSPTFSTAPSPIDAKHHAGSPYGPRGYGFQSAPSALQHMKIEQSNGGDVVMTSPELSAAPAHKKPGFDGMSALLRAGEIVDRRNE